MSARAIGWTLGGLFGVICIGFLIWVGMLVNSDGMGQFVPVAVQQGLGNSRSYAMAVNPTTLMVRQPPDAADPNDIRDVVLTMNGEGAPALPTQFDAAHAQRIAPHCTVTTRGDGIVVVQMPARSPLRAPVAQDGRVYVGAGFASVDLYCLDGATGQPIWAASLSDNGPSAAALGGGSVVVNTESCSVFTIDAQTGKPKWALYLADPQMARPTVAHNTVYTSYPNLGGLRVNYSHDITQDDQSIVGTHAVAAFDLDTGELKWQKWVDGEVMTEPIVDGDRVHVATFSGTLYQFDAQTGDILQARANRVTSAPVVRDGKLYYTCRVDGEGEAPREAMAIDDATTGLRLETLVAADAPHLDAAVQARSGYASQGRSLDMGNGFGEGAPPASNAEKALANIGLNHVSTLQGFEGARVTLADASGSGDNSDGPPLAYSTRGDRVVCVNLASGSTVWERVLPGSIKREGGSLGSPPLILGDEVVLGTVSGELWRLNAATGETLATYAMNAPVRAKPAADRDHVYVGTEQGQLLIVPMR